MWNLIPHAHDGEDGVLFGVMDFNNGASFGFDLSYPSPDEYFEYEHGEAEYFSRLFNVDNNVIELEKFKLAISNIEFRCAAYLFNNRKFGVQHLIRGMYIGESVVMGMNMAWTPHLSTKGGVTIPPKLQFFIDNMVLGSNTGA
ncbi:hypothetical protein GCM10025791_37920 [Halioxenophilus aromaticivorans]|uniref:Uncharacterized protein n=1 Tax=Halioxenophilus aromaticivorans TaxID=1306992 RepID=A0AAV3U7D0_9ALTE